MGLSTTSTPPTGIVFPQGVSIVSHLGARLGGMDAQVVSQLTDNLISLSDLVKQGSIVVFNNDEGLIYNLSNSKVIPIWQEGLAWRITLHKLLDYDHLPNQSTAGREINPPLLYDSSGEPIPLNYPYDTRTSSAAYQALSAHASKEVSVKRGSSHSSCMDTPEAVAAAQRRAHYSGRIKAMSYFPLGEAVPTLYPNRFCPDSW